MPSFVLLVPFLALFAATRFTAIAAAIVFAAPVVIRSLSMGSCVSAQREDHRGGFEHLADDHQGPVADAREALTCDNQGLIYVLSMVVVGGLVGAGALGYDVVPASRRASSRQGLAAGLAIVLLGIMLDRITKRGDPVGQAIHHR